MPALNTLRADPDWDTALLVLHGLVNGALISHALTGGKAHLGRLEQQPGCINVLDVGEHHDDWVVRAINVCPDLSAYQSTRLLTVEHMLDQVLRSRR
ncbi:histidine phosphatase family protein [Undibacterium arcticum]